MIKTSALGLAAAPRHTQARPSRSLPLSMERQLPSFGARRPRCPTASAAAWTLPHPEAAAAAWAAHPALQQLQAELHASSEERLQVRMQWAGKCR